MINDLRNIRRFADIVEYLENDLWAAAEGTGKNGT
jgi:hypothetical protein